MNSDMDSLQQYRRRVSDDHEEICIEAYHEIGDLGIPEGNEMLLQGLSDRDPLVCAEVRGILTEIADEKIIKMLLELLRVEDPGLRSQAMTVLSQLGHAALRQIEVYLKDADRDVRILAANIIAAGGLKQSFPALKQALQDPEENVRYAVVEALGRIEVQEAIPLLLDILSDEWARYPAIEALGLLKAQEAIPFLLELYDRDEWVRNAVIEALGNIGAADTVAFLIDRIDINNEMLLHATLVSIAKIEQKTPTGAFGRLNERGEIVLTVLPIEGEASLKSPRYLQFSVRDTGIGISADKIDTIFEKFTQSDSSITRKYGGTGLGLAISKQLIELMGGRIWVESRPGEGSTFFFTIPSEAAPPEEKQETASRPEIGMQGLKIIIVDDNITNRLILRETMAQWGCVVTEAADGAEGLTALNKAKDEGTPLHVALLDSRMPGMDGFTFAQEIRGKPNLVALDIMMLTSESRSGERRQAKALDMEDNLSSR